MPPTHIIAADQRLSQSTLWQIQRRYFLRSGMKAWQDDVVPHAISSSPLMARSYSQIVLGYLRDCVSAAQYSDFLFDASQPIYIVELGAGSGRLAHHFLHEFHDLLSQSPLAHLRVTYVMTDFVPEIVAFWQNQAQFRPWIEAGLLDFALYDVAEISQKNAVELVEPVETNGLRQAQAPLLQNIEGRKRPFTLLHAARTLTPEQVSNPLILIANYFFDSIPQDSFVIEDGQLCQNLLTLYSTQPEPDLADPAIWDRLTLAYEAIPLAEPCYKHDLYNEILDDYEAALPDTTITFPNVGLDCLREWQKWGNGRFLLLTSDRGHTLPETLLDQPDPLPNLHGSFSLMVNYHAIGQYTQKSGGLCLHTDHYQDNLQVNGYLWGLLPQTAAETRLAYTTAVSQGGPDDFFALTQALEPNLAGLTLPQILSCLRLSAWDADLFHACYPTLLNHTQEASAAWYPDIQDTLSHIQRRYLPLTAADNLATKIDRLLQIMQLA